MNAQRPKYNLNMQKRCYILHNKQTKGLINSYTKQTLKSLASFRDDE